MHGVVPRRVMGCMRVPRRVLRMQDAGRKTVSGMPRRF